MEIEITNAILEMRELCKTQHKHHCNSCWWSGFCDQFVDMPCNFTDEEINEMKFI